MLLINWPCHDFDFVIDVPYSNKILAFMSHSGPFFWEGKMQPVF
jgi:hypothetical protein